MTTDKAARKERPIARGFLDYFPDAVAEVAHVSFKGNQQHNPGQELHWSRGKSSDHADCLARHLMERGTIDDDGLRHSAKAAWRALAMLQIELETSERYQDDKLEAITGLQGVIGPDPVEAVDALDTATWAPKSHTFVALPGTPARHLMFKSVAPERDWTKLHELGCPDHVALQIVNGTSYTSRPFTATNDPGPYVYIAGPMRGIENFNFPAFDAARERFVTQGFNVISPADIDRAAGDVNVDKATYTCTQTDFAFRDFWSLYFLSKMGNPANGIVLLPGWEKSTGAAGEFFLSRWIGLRFYSVSGAEYVTKNFLHDFALAHATVKH